MARSLFGSVQIESPFFYLADTIPVTSSFGAVWINLETISVEDMIRHADEALYAAEASGRNRIVLYRSPSQPSALFETNQTTRHLSKTPR
jgi:GGDEF domain-containing protein